MLPTQISKILACIPVLVLIYCNTGSTMFGIQMYTEKCSVSISGGLYQTHFTVVIAIVTMYC